MAAKATIPLKLGNSTNRLKWTDLTSEKIELAGFEWHVTGQAKTGSIRSISIHCTPVGGKNTSIWNCEAYGQIMMTAERFQTSLKRSKHWLQSFNPRCSNSSFIDAELGGYIVRSGGYTFKAVVNINVLSHDLIDLSVPDNKMIQSSDDAAQVTVEGETLWLSKSFVPLSIEAHVQRGLFQIFGCRSPFFKAHFIGDSKEKIAGLYEFNKFVLEEFLHFISIIYGLPARIDSKSVEYLLKMADNFQCDLVTNQCRDFLYQNEAFPSQKKLELADRYGFFDVVFKLVQTMGAADLKNCAASCGFSLPTTELLFKRLDEFVGFAPPVPTNNTTLPVPTNKTTLPVTTNTAPPVPFRGTDFGGRVSQFRRYAPSYSYSDCEPDISDLFGPEPCEW